MKRLFCACLAALLVLSLVACGKEKAEETSGIPKVESFSVGYGKVDVTPESGTPMGGYGHPLTKLSTTVSDPLYIIFIAMSDGEDTVLMCAMDIVNSSEYFVTAARKKIAEETGVPEDQIIMCATHNHSSPDLGTTACSNAQGQKAYDQWINGAVEAAKIALKDMAPATIQGGKTETEGLAFVRHYLMNDGTYAGDNFGNWASMIKDYALPVDNELVVVKFARENKKDIMLLNFQVHPCFEAGDTLTVISADAPGATRDYVAEQTGAEVVYFTGAAGNQNYKSLILQDITNDTKQQWAQKLGDYAINTTLTDISGQDIKFTYETYTGDVWKVDDVEKYQHAKEVYELFQQTDRDTATPLAKQYGLASVYEAREIVSHMENMDDTDTLEMKVISVGDWGIVSAPYEMFGTQGTKIKDESPFSVTTIMAYSGPLKGYIPDQRAYEYGCYESQTAIFVSGTGEILAEKYLEMLQALK